MCWIGTPNWRVHTNRWSRNWNDIWGFESLWASSWYIQVWTSFNVHETLLWMGISKYPTPSSIIVINLFRLPRKWSCSSPDTPRTDTRQQYSHPRIMHKHTVQMSMGLTYAHTYTEQLGIGNLASWIGLLEMINNKIEHFWTVLFVHSPHSDQGSRIIFPSQILHFQQHSTFRTCLQRYKR